MTNQDIPKHLSHKPIIGLYYELIDQLAGSGDAKFLSIGISQWDEKDISAKIFRRTWEEGRWSPQSEEMPFWRVLDLAQMVIATLLGKNSLLGEESVSEGEEEQKRDKKILEGFLKENAHLYADRMKAIKELLEDLE